MASLNNFFPFAFVVIELSGWNRTQTSQSHFGILSNIAETVVVVLTFILWQGPQCLSCPGLQFSVQPLEDLPRLLLVRILQRKKTIWEEGTDKGFL